MKACNTISLSLVNIKNFVLDNFEIFKKTIEEINGDFIKNNDLIIDNNSERYMFQNSEINRFIKSKNCFFKGCQNKSIKRSHTIQRAGSLTSISENGNLLTPNYKNEKTFEMRKVGLKIASTFPGFCQEHENLFQSFEAKKDITYENELVLQLYRAIAREIIVREHNLNELKKIRIKYLTFRDDKLTKLFKKKLKENGFYNPNLTLGKFNFRINDRVISTLDREIESLQNYLNYFLYDYHTKIISDLKKQKFKNIYVKNIEIDTKIPVALSSSVSMGIHIRSKDKIIDVIANVIPYEHKTYFILSTLKKNKEVLDLIYKYKQLDVAINIINVIESIMINDTDNWYITPSVWNIIGEKYKEEILKDMAGYFVSNSATHFGL